MKTDLRKKINPNREIKNDVLFRFYKWWDLEEDKEVTEAEVNEWGEKNGWEIWSKFECIEEHKIDPHKLKKNWKFFSEMMEKYGDKYDDIDIDYDMNDDGYTSKFRIVGKRMETEEECRERVKAEETKRDKAIQDKLNKKIAKEQAKIDREKKMLEELQAKYNN